MEKNNGRDSDIVHGKKNEKETCSEQRLKRQVGLCAPPAFSQIVDRSCLPSVGTNDQRPGGSADYHRSRSPSGRHATITVGYTPSASKCPYHQGVLEKSKQIFVQIKARRRSVAVATRLRSNDEMNKKIKTWSVRFWWYGH